MRATQLDHLAAELEKHFGLTGVSGWRFSFEYPGIFQFTRDSLIFSCTPDWHQRGEICIQLATDDGRGLDGWDVKYPHTLTAELFVELMKPYLEKAAQHLPKEIKSSVTYEQYGKHIVERHRRWRENDQIRGWIHPHVGQLAAELSRLLRERLSVQARRELASNRPMAAKHLAQGADHFATAGAALVEAWARIALCTSQQATDVIQQSKWGREIADEAWAIAREFEFRLEWGAARNSSGRTIPAFGFKHDGHLVTNARRSPMGRSEVITRVYYGISEKTADRLDALNRGLDLMY